LDSTGSRELIVRSSRERRISGRPRRLRLACNREGPNQLDCLTSLLAVSGRHIHRRACAACRDDATGGGDAGGVGVEDAVPTAVVSGDATLPVDHIKRV
jgi:hypothetical protein